MGFLTRSTMSIYSPCICSSLPFTVSLLRNSKPPPPLSISFTLFAAPLEHFIYFILLLLVTYRSVTRKWWTDLGVLRLQIGMPVLPRLSDKTHSAQLFLIYIQLHRHTCMCVHVCSQTGMQPCVHARTWCLCLSCKLTHTKLNKSLQVSMCLNKFLWQVAEPEATVCQTNQNSARQFLQSKT